MPPSVRRLTDFMALYLHTGGGRLSSGQDAGGYKARVSSVDSPARSRPCATAVDTLKGPQARKRVPARPEKDLLRFLIPRSEALNDWKGDVF